MVAELRKKNNQILICVDSDRIQNFFQKLKIFFILKVISFLVKPFNSNCTV